ncbi:hypothetical protein [Sphingobium nicotianae]|uniref:Uncharacterized protein n=1 Tax=Sphingobium nicotianae TaxID=2782607 RepID=A0A9X1IRT2_9SPHN|nr:hypothetical protein [Sphingobium nicotianae]MBT2187816.1 hypothetical protein [Sphingobium nicotianae]
MTPAPRLATSESSMRGTLRSWRAALRRTFLQPDSITLLSLAPEDVAKRLAGAHSPSA